MVSRPSDVGIKGIELYFPRQCVYQAELERFDRVTQGKYTIGLGQTKMSFCDDREDIYSFALTTLSSLIKKYSIGPKNIGRLEVGTETILYKSKIPQLCAHAAVRGVRGVNIKHEYDSYKPESHSKYSVISGHYSMQCYTKCVETCYRLYNAREQRLSQSSSSNGSKGQEKHQVPLNCFDHFHTSTCKLVSKSYARLLYNDYLSDPTNPLFAELPEEMKDPTYEASMTDKSVEKMFIALAKEGFVQRVQPTSEVPTLCGNMYCAGVYSSLCSLLMDVESEQLQDKKVGVFSYGGGSASSFFSLRIKGGSREITEKLDIKNRHRGEQN